MKKVISIVKKCLLYYVVFLVVVGAGAVLFGFAQTAFSADGRSATAHLFGSLWHLVSAMSRHLMRS